MSFANVLFCVNLLLCGVNVLSESRDPYFGFHVYKKFKYDGILPVEYSFEEGMQYTVTCTRSPGWNLDWEIEPYGLKSSTLNDGGGSDNTFHNIEITFKLQRDDQITIRCYSKNNETYREENKTTHFVWDQKIKPASSTPPPPTSVSMDAGDDDDHKYPKNNTGKYASLQLRGCWYQYCLYDFQIYTRINSENVNGISTSSHGLGGVAPTTLGPSDAATDTEKKIV